VAARVASVTEPAALHVVSGNGRTAIEHELSLVAGN
jgi:hypothetical protein